MSSEVIPDKNLLVTSLIEFEIEGNCRETRKRLVDKIGTMIPHFVSHIAIGEWNVPVPSRSIVGEVWDFEQLQEYTKYAD